MNELIAGRYQILQKLGAGAMGQVYLAEDTILRRKAALKFLSPRYSSDTEFKARFLREARAAAALNHPNIIIIFDVGEYQDRAFIAMEYVEGESLKDVLAGQELPIDAVIDCVTQICEGLGEAHRAGIVHVPIIELGNKAVKYILKMINGEVNSSESYREEVSTGLVVGGSCGCANPAGHSIF